MGVWVGLITLAIVVLGIAVAVGRKDEKADSTTELAKETRVDQLKHFKECDDRAKDIAQKFAVIQQQLETGEKEIGAMRTTQVWVGDCLVAMAARFNVELPPRPR